jgi:hypothetical protein
LRFEVEKTAAMIKEISEWQENAGMTGKNAGRRESMKSYQKEADRYFASHKTAVTLPMLIRLLSPSAARRFMRLCYSRRVPRQRVGTTRQRCFTALTVR